MRADRWYERKWLGVGLMSGASAIGIWQRQSDGRASFLPGPRPHSSPERSGSTLQEHTRARASIPVGLARGTSAPARVRAPLGEPGPRSPSSSVRRVPRWREWGSTTGRPARRAWQVGCAARARAAGACAFASPAGPWEARWWLAAGSLMRVDDVGATRCSERDFCPGRPRDTAPYPQWARR